MRTVIIAEGEIVMKTVTRIGFLHSGTKENFDGPVAALTLALPPGVQMIERWGDDDSGMLADGAKELVEDPEVQVIVAAGGPDPALLLKRLTANEKFKKSIVFTTVADPEVSGLVATKDKPGNNLTGMAGKTSELDAARLTVLNVLIGGQPGDRFGVLRFADRDHGDEQYAKIVEAANNLRLELKPKKAATKLGIEKAFEFFVQEKVKGLVVTADSFFNNNRKDVVALAARHKIPAIYQWREFVKAGGLVSYGPSILEAYQMAGKYVTQILERKGAPSDMPCSEPSSFAIDMNFPLAQQLGIAVPDKLNDIPVRAI